MQTSSVDPTTPNSKRAELLDGAVVANQIKSEVAAEVQRLNDAHGVQPCLVAVLVGDDPASAVYVRNKMRACEEVGIRSEHHALAAATSAGGLAYLIESLNMRQEV